jgi:hydrogenase 3 maturation protease
MLPELEYILSDEKKTVLFAGIGNVLKSDDGAGVYISQKIINSPNITSLSVEMSIENYIGKINQLAPDILILIDCMEMNSPPGTFRFMQAELVSDLTFNTHNISLGRLKEFFNMPSFILGIQPEKIDFGEKLSYIVKKVSDNLINLINKQEVYNGY